MCRSLVVSGNRGLRQPRLVSQALQSLSLSSCSNLDSLYLSCPQLTRLQASPSRAARSCCAASSADNGCPNPACGHTNGYERP